MGLGLDLLFLLGVALLLGLVVNGWLRQPRLGASPWVGADAVRAALELEERSGASSDLADFLLCTSTDVPDAVRARTLARVARYLSPETLGPLLVFMGARCGTLTCAEILRLARFHPEPSKVERSAIVIVDGTSSETLRLIAIDALAEIGSVYSLRMLRALAEGDRSLAIRNAATQALVALEARLVPPPRLDGAVSLTEEAGAVSLTEEAGALS